MRESPASKSYEYDVNVIKSQVTMEQLLQHFQVPYPQGKAQITIKSLWREERTPSLSINLSRNIWRDAGQVHVDPKSNRRIPGNVIGFTQMMLGCSFFEALKYLGDTFGLVEDKAGKSHENSVRGTRQQIQERIQELPERSFLSPQADYTPKPNKIHGKAFDPRHLRVEGLSYFEEKGINVETIRRFKCGQIKSYLKKSRFVGRIVFPIYNARGELVQYGSRSANPASAGESRYDFYPGFKTSLELFGIERLTLDPEVRKVVEEHGIIVVEGFSDVMKLDQLGFRNVVGAFGSSLSERQVELLADPVINPKGAVKLFFDNDSLQVRYNNRVASGMLSEKVWVKSVDWDLAKGQTEPEHFFEGDRELLSRMLEQFGFRGYERFE